MSKNRKYQGISLKELRQQFKNVTIMDTVKDIYENCANSKLDKKLNTGLVFDNEFTFHKCDWDANYPENPKRYESILQRLKQCDLLQRCKKIDSRLATIDEIRSVHSYELIEILVGTINKNLTKLEELASNYDAIYFNQKTYHCAKLAAGSVLNLVKAVVSNEVQNGMAIVRPPGHHAMRSQFCGYCFFNNVAMAAKYALTELNLKKILIVDWDVHHGQGTQQMFYNDDRVLYFSIHRYEHGLFWPNLKESNFDFVGEGNGCGYNINVPLNETECGDADYIAIFQKILLPVAYEFEPELILISAGFDAALGDNEVSGYDSAIGDEKGLMTVTPGCYHHLTTSLMGLAKGRVVVVLEGGYFLPSLAESCAQTLKALLGDPSPLLDPLNKPKECVLKVINILIINLLPFWKCFSVYNINNQLSNIIIPATDYCGTEEIPPYLTRNCYPVSSRSEIRIYKGQISRLICTYYHNRILNVGYVHDKIMELHKSAEPHIYETPERLIACCNILSELNLLQRMELITGRAATYQELRYVHDENYIKKIQTLINKNESYLNKHENWVTVFTNDSTMKSATMAAGSVIELVRNVLRGSISSGVAIIRPPGHHAESETAGGFCFFNNVAIAASYALKWNVNRILIVDWDIHHGNGIQKMFYNKRNVLYMSIHRYDNAHFYPFSTDGNYTKIGENRGTGYNINIPFNHVRLSDADYLAVFNRIILPIAYEYNPELVLVAAGFDACVGDPLGGYKVTPEAYGHFVQLLKPLAGGRIIIAMEGGYNVNSLGYGVAMCCKALLNDPLPPLTETAKIQKATIDVIHQVINTHKQYWSSLEQNDVLLELLNKNNKDKEQE